MAGGLLCGKSEVVGALRRIKSYLDYGIFQPIQIAAIIALNGPQDCVKEICDTYKERRDALISGLNRVGWEIESPKATMFVWGKIPDQYLIWDLWNSPKCSSTRPRWLFHRAWDLASMGMIMFGLP